MGKTVYLDVDLPEELIDRGREVAAVLGMSLEEWLVKRMEDELAQWENGKHGDDHEL